jgi:lipoprotein-releasing system permease protein
MYGEFDPDFLISPREGMVFDKKLIDTASILAIEGVEGLSFILEGNALLEYKGRQTTATVRGVDEAFAAIVPIEKMVTAGRFTGSGAVVGQGVAYALGLWGTLTEQLRFYAPSRGSYSVLLPMSGFSSGRLDVEAVFALDAATDSKYVVVPLGFAQHLFDYKDRVSSLMVGLQPAADEKEIAGRLGQLLGEGFKVENRLEQKASMYRIMAFEKWSIFFIGLMVLVIALFSVVGSIIMLVIDKRNNIRTIAAMGGSLSVVRGIFIRQGMMIGLIGAAGGLLLGVAVCGVQQIFGVVPMPAESFLVDSYPVRMKLLDLVVIAVAVVAINYIITIFTVRATVRAKDIRA